MNLVGVLLTRLLIFALGFAIQDTFAGRCTCDNNTQSLANLLELERADTLSRIFVRSAQWETFEKTDVQVDDGAVLLIGQLGCTLAIRFVSINSSVPVVIVVGGRKVPVGESLYAVKYGTGERKYGVSECENACTSELELGKMIFTESNELGILFWNTSDGLGQRLNTISYGIEYRQGCRKYSKMNKKQIGAFDLPLAPLTQEWLAQTLYFSRPFRYLDDLHGTYVWRLHQPAQECTLTELEMLDVRNVELQSRYRFARIPFRSFSNQYWDLSFRPTDNEYFLRFRYRSFCNVTKEMKDSVKEWDVTGITHWVNSATTEWTTVSTKLENVTQSQLLLWRIPQTDNNYSRIVVQDITDDNSGLYTTGLPSEIKGNMEWEIRRNHSIQDHEELPPHISLSVMAIVMNRGLNRSFPFKFRYRAIPLHEDNIRTIEVENRIHEHRLGPQTDGWRNLTMDMELPLVRMVSSDPACFIRVELIESSVLLVAFPFGIRQRYPMVKLERERTTPFRGTRSETALRTSGSELGLKLHFPDFCPQTMFAKVRYGLECPRTIASSFEWQQIHAANPFLILSPLEKSQDEGTCWLQIFIPARELTEHHIHNRWSSRQSTQQWAVRCLREDKISSPDITSRLMNITKCETNPMLVFSTEVSDAPEAIVEIVFRKQCDSKKGAVIRARDHPPRGHILVATDEWTTIDTDSGMDANVARGDSPRGWTLYPESPACQIELVIDEFPFPYPDQLQIFEKLTPEKHESYPRNLVKSQGWEEKATARIEGPITFASTDHVLYIAHECSWTDEQCENYFHGRFRQVCPSKPDDRVIRLAAKTSWQTYEMISTPTNQLVNTLVTINKESVTASDGSSFVVEVKFVALLETMLVGISRRSDTYPRFSQIARTVVFSPRSPLESWEDFSADRGQRSGFLLPPMRGRSFFFQEQAVLLSEMFVPVGTSLYTIRFRLRPSNEADHEYLYGHELTATDVPQLITEAIPTEFSDMERIRVLERLMNNSYHHPLGSFRLYAFQDRWTIRPARSECHVELKFTKLDIGNGYMDGQPTAQQMRLVVYRDLKDTSLLHQYNTYCSSYDGLKVNCARLGTVFQSHTPPNGLIISFTAGSTARLYPAGFSKGDNYPESTWGSGWKAEYRQVCENSQSIAIEPIRVVANSKEWACLPSFPSSDESFIDLRWNIRPLWDWCKVEVKTEGNASWPTVALSPYDLRNRQRIPRLSPLNSPEDIYPEQYPPVIVYRNHSSAVVRVLRYSPLPGYRFDLQYRLYCHEKQLRKPLSAQMMSDMFSQILLPHTVALIVFSSSILLVLVLRLCICRMRVRHTGARENA